jgi:cyclophilin family peptidyl-prolyl cis-trans isomerase
MPLREVSQQAKRGYYDGCPIHRIVKDFVIQTGDPTGTGKGGLSIYGYENSIAFPLNMFSNYTHSCFALVKHLRMN